MTQENNVINGQITFTTNKDGKETMRKAYSEKRVFSDTLVRQTNGAVKASFQAIISIVYAICKDARLTNVSKGFELLADSPSVYVTVKRQRQIVSDFLQLDLESRDKNESPAEFGQLVLTHFENEFPTEFDNWKANFEKRQTAKQIDVLDLTIYRLTEKGVLTEQQTKDISAIVSEVKDVTLHNVL